MRLRIASLAAMLLANLQLSGCDRLPAAQAAARPVPAALGGEALCAAGTGLPAGWGRQKQAGMAWIPSGNFTLGSQQGYADERPAMAAQAVAGFWMDQTEVSNAQFAAFVQATGYVTQAEQEGGAVVFHQPTQDELARRPYAWWTYVKGADWRHPTGPASNAPAGNTPVTMVTQADALAYARWLGRDLPTEAEWEYAAKAGRSDAELDKAPVDRQRQPTANYWQGAFPLLNTQQDHHAGLAPVGCYQANAFALYDMIGNAWEWTRDAYSGAHQAHANGDTAAVAAAARHAAPLQPNQPMVIKGGSFLCSPDFCVRYRASAREAQEADLGAAHIGFRTVLRDG